MLTSDLINSARFLLHDTVRQSDTGLQFFEDGTIGRAMTDALAVLVRELLLPQDAKTGVRTPRSAHLSVGPLANVLHPSWTGAAPNNSAPLPDDFFVLEAGSLGGLYVPAIATPLGETLAGTGIAKLYAFSGNLYGPQCDQVYYFARPPVIDPDNAAATLPLLSDAVYNCMKYAACRDLVVQHSKSAWHRWGFFQNEYLTQKESLQ